MGGANRSLLYLILELKKLGVECEVLLPRTKVQPKFCLKDKLKQNNIPFIEEYYFWYRVNCRYGFIRYCSNVVWYSKILIKLRGRKYDIVHSNSSFTDLGVWISLWKRIPHIWHLREYGNWGGAYPALGRKFDYYLTSKTAVGIAISKKQSEYYLPLFPKNRIEVVYNGIENRHVSLKKRVSDIFHFCIVGNLCEGKNQIMAIEALARLVQMNLTQKFHLTLIGSGAQYQTILQKRISELNLTDYVTFTGEIENVDEILDQMNCGLVLTYNEAFGRVTVEYMLHGLPVIATDSGANPELVKDGSTGYIIGQTDYESLALRMRDLILNQSFAEELGREGRIYAKNSFSVKTNAGHIKDIYTHL